MSSSTSLNDAYRHPGFVPEQQARLDKTESTTFILPLRRRGKKTSAEAADKTCMAITTILFDKPETSTVAAAPFSWNSSFDGSSVPGAA
jgi:hypothetical protein